MKHIFQNLPITSTTNQLQAQEQALQVLHGTSLVTNTATASVELVPTHRPAPVAHRHHSLGFAGVALLLLIIAIAVAIEIETRIKRARAPKLSETAPATPPPPLQ